MSDDLTTQDKIDALLDERKALNELMATFDDERRAHNYARRDYIDERLEVLRERVKESA